MDCPTADCGPHHLDFPLQSIRQSLCPVHSPLYVCWQERPAHRGVQPDEILILAAQSLSVSPWRSAPLTMVVADSQPYDMLAHANLGLHRFWFQCVKKLRRHDVGYTEEKAPGIDHLGLDQPAYSPKVKAFILVPHKSSVGRQLGQGLQPLEARALLDGDDIVAAVMLLQV